jgi:hypothetical protein
MFNITKEASMFANFTNSVKGGRSGKADYSLNEILAILDMVNNEITKEEIARITGRTKDSLNYKIFEGQTTINGKTNVRSIKRFWFVDPTVKGSAMKTTEEALKALFLHHGETYVDEADIQARIDSYVASLEAQAV